MSEPVPNTPTVRVFSCPYCGYTMNTAQSRCPSCSTAIDLASAEAAADTLSIVDQAISDASYVSIVLYTILGVVPLLLGWVAKMHLTLPLLFVSPNLPGIATALFLLGLLVAVTMCGVAAMAFRWWLRFGGLSSTDPEFVSGRRKVLFAAAISTLFVVTMSALTVALYLHAA